jgi:alpha-N-arabinofuranosidase
VVNAGSDTFPLDVAAAWTEDRHTLTVAVLNPTDTDQLLKLNISGADLSGQGTMWQLASAEPNGQNPKNSHSPIDSVPDSLALPRFSVSLYDFSVR